jgi:lysophospholipase L1-like esterase
MVAVLLGLAAVALLWLQPLAADAAPTPQPARTGPPNSIAVIGDSISAGTGTTGLPASEQPQNSWATGTNNNSVYQRILAINPAISGRNQNVAANGNDMTDALAMANQVNLNTDLILIQLGGNDLCKSSVSQMTPVEQYRSEFVAALNAIRARNPNALIQVQSIPDIFNLWYVRGAPGSVNGQESASAGTARTFWNLGLIPCESLVANPTSTSATDNNRRNQVRSRDLALNYVLQQECGAVLRCRFDQFATFDFSSNRSDPGNLLGINRSIDSTPWGNYEGYRPPAEWQFEDADVSTIDHFHPSNSGHRKLAEAAWLSGYDYSDSAAPSLVSSDISPVAMSNGVHRQRPTVTHSWTDAAGVRGLEYRLRTDGDGAGGAWTQALSSSIAVPVNLDGVSWLESRAFDVNGNRSASVLTRVEYDPARLPAATILSAPPSTVAGTSATLGFSSEAGLSTECSLDGGAWQPCSSPQQLESLPQGLRTFAVRHFDPATGNRGPAAQASWTVDTVAPAAPVIAGVPTARTNATTASIQFSGEPGGTYQCSLNAAPSSPCSSPLQLTGLAEGAYTVAVRQTDAAGNAGPEASASWTVDTTPPPVPLLTGAPPEFTSSTSAQISIGRFEAGSIFQCSVNGSAWATCTSPLSLSGLTDGTRTVAVRQVDQAGNASATATVSWVVDTSPPGAPAFTVAPFGTIGRTFTSFSFAGEPQAAFECRLDSEPWGACMSPRNVNGLTEGAHTFSVRQSDRAGNTGPPVSVTWNVDLSNSPPQLTGTPPPLSASRSANLTFSGKQDWSFICSLDGAAFTPCTSPFETSGLGDGEHSFSVRQADGFGRVSPPATVVWLVDATAPSAPVFDQAPPAVTSSRSLSARFAGEQGAVFECRENGGPWQPCSSPRNYSSLSDGPHSLEVRQSDEAGNTGPAARIDWVVDTTRPAAPVLTGLPTGTVRSTAATGSIQGEPSGRFECRRNGSSWAACQSPLAIDGLPQGTQLLEVRQVDAAGNVGEVAGATWIVDTVAPRLSGTVKAKRKGITVTITSTFVATLGRPSKIEYATTRPAPSPATRPVPSRTLKWAPTIKVRSRQAVTWVRVSDPAGNQSPWSRVR